ncbi:unnamed protein product [Sphagnum jensenii]|uniref:Leucine-rich repeat family protein n=1 Tax=Sphagnum jensenii TaxID=128206 RepID=A0ABP1BU68_9BRYO
MHVRHTLVSISLPHAMHPSCAVLVSMHVSDAGVEVAYEGGDEHDEELAEDTALGGGHILVNADSTRYYETHSNGDAEGFSGGCGDNRHFSDGDEICVEIGNDYVSDPGVYNCKDDLEMASSPYFDLGSKSGHRSEDLPVVEMQSECLLKGKQQHRPWWKVFLFTHRNIHRRVPLGLPLSNGFGGYGSEVDYCSDNRPHPMFLQEQPFQDETFVGDRKAVEIMNMEGECVVDMSTSNFDAVAAQLPVATSSSSLMAIAAAMDIAGDRKVYIPHKADLSRVEEWVNSIDFASHLPVDKDIENDDVQTSREPSSPTAPALTFFSTRAQSSSGHQMNVDGDGSLMGGDAEMAALIARSVNPLSTVAYFSGVGLRIIPPLALYNSLKTLNLSANHILRIMPGLLPRSLHSLDLSRNKIVVIEGLRELARLRVLNLSHNRISRIGHGLAGCSSLRELHLAGNKISEIEGLHRLLKLSLLDLSFNKLTTTKAISQLAANYNSLQALNLLGNPLHSNLGEEPLRKLVTGLAPNILYLNKQATKAISARDAAVDSVARAALGTPSHHHHTPRGSKGSRGGLGVLPVASSSSQGKFRNGEKGGHSLNTVLGGGYARTGMTKETTHKQQYHQNPHHHHHHRQRHSGTKALQSLGSSQLHPLAVVDSRHTNGDANWTVLAAPQNGMNRIRSDGSLYEHGLRTVDSPFA